MPFNNNLSNNERLSIHVFENGLSFYDNSSIFFFDFESCKNQIEKNLIFFLKNNTLDEFKKVRCIFFNEPATFVPFSIFDPAKVEVYLKQNISLNSTKKEYFDETDDKSIKIIYQLRNDLIKILQRNFNEILFSHYTKILYDRIINHLDEVSNFKIYIHLHENIFDILLFQNKKLLLYNTYPHKNHEDFLFFLLAVIDQFTTNSGKIFIFFLGRYNRFINYYNSIQIYQKEIIYLEDNEYSISSLEKHPAPYFINF